MPVLNGTNHDEELIFVVGLGVAVSGGMFVPVPGHEPGEFKLGAIFSDWFYDHTVGLLGKPWTMSELTANAVSLA